MTARVKDTFLLSCCTPHTFHFTIVDDTLQLCSPTIRTRFLLLVSNEDSGCLAASAGGQRDCLRGDCRCPPLRARPSCTRDYRRCSYRRRTTTSPCSIERDSFLRRYLRGCNVRFGRSVICRRGGDEWLPVMNLMIVILDLIRIMTQILHGSVSNHWYRV